MTVTGVGAAAWVAGDWFQPTLAPASCHWCEVDALDDAVRASPLPDLQTGPEDDIEGREIAAVDPVRGD